MRTKQQVWLHILGETTAQISSLTVMSSQKNNLRKDQIPRGPFLLLWIPIYIDSCLQRVRLLRAPGCDKQFVTHC